MLVVRRHYIIVKHINEIALSSDIAIVALALTCGAVTSASVYFFYRNGWRSGLKLIASLLVGTFVGIAVLLVFFFQSLGLIFSDSSIFRARNSVQLNFHSAAGEILEVDIRYAAKIRLGDESAIDLSVSFPGNSRDDAIHVYRAGMDGHADLKIRPAEPCETHAFPDDILPIPNCSFAVASSSVRQVRWFFSPSREGRSFVSIVLRSADIAKIIENKDYRVSIFFNNERYTVPIHSRTGMRWRPGESRSDLVFEEVVLTHDSPNLASDDVEVDIRRATVIVPLDAEKTLDISASTYGVIAALISFLAAMLGSGWVWKLIEVVNRSRAARNDAD